MNLTIADIVSAGYIGASNIDQLRRRKFKGVSTDSRTVKPGELFIALRGESFNGNLFAADAFARGAACVIIDERSDRAHLPEMPFFIVSDTMKMLGALAKIYRKKFSIPILAVAGSNGKTTTKEMITAVLRSKYSVLSTQGNLNNHIGVPQTIFQLNSRHEVAVVEIGTNHFGELRYLCEILAPSHGVITNIGREHLEFFKDLEGVARAEGELFEALGASGIGFVNVDDRYILQEAARLKKRITYSSTSGRVNVRGSLLSINDAGCAEFLIKPLGKKPFEVTLAAPGKHAMTNALASAAVGLAMNVPVKKIQKALHAFTSMGKRMEVLNVEGVVILNDTYNANPDSVLAAMETLSAMRCRGKKILILADMLELGTRGPLEHERIGYAVNEMAFEYLLTHGPLARYIHQKAKTEVNLYYEAKNILAEFAAELVTPGDIVLVKGSRGMKMEDVVIFLQERLQKRAA